MRILYSTSRSALRDQCLREVCGLTAQWPDRRAILIVPEQTKMDMERDYLSCSGQGGLMMAEILSFRRLAWRLLGEIGQQPRQSIDAVGQGMLIHRTLVRNQADLHSFGHLADRPGFISQAAAALGDLKRYQIDAAQLLAASRTAEDKALQDKTNDLGILLRGYDQALAESGLSDAEDDLNLLGEVLSQLQKLPVERWAWPFNRLTWLRSASVWVSGFGELRDFTPQEDAILRALHQLCADMTLTVATDLLPFDRLAVESGADCFLPGRKTVWRLLQDNPGSRTELIPDPVSGHGAVIAACFREGRLCLPPDDAGRAWLRLVRADGLDAELSWVAGEIRRLVQLDGYRYHDIALAVCDLPGYTSRLRAVCREYGVPLFLDAGRPLSGTPLMRFVLALLDIGLHNWPMSAILTALRSGLTPLDPAEIDLLENEMLARGIRSNRLLDDARYAGPASLASRDKAFRPWQALLTELKSNDSGTAKCYALHRFLVDYGLADRIEKRAADLTAAGETDAAVAQVQSWNELLRVLEQMAKLNDDQPLSLQTFRDLLAAGIESAGGNVIPTAIDQVAVGDLKRAMLRQPKVLFIVGATARALPPGLPPEGLLKDQDRQTLSGLLNRQLPSSVRDQAFADAFVLGTLLTLPSDRLCLTSPMQEVSPWFKWLAADQPEAVTVVPPAPDWQDGRLNAVRPAFGYLLSRSATGAAVSAGWLAVGQVLREAGQPIADGIDWLRRAVPGATKAVRIPPELVRALYASTPVMSISQLEKYAGCPFLHLATYLLALQEREIWAPEAAEAGSLLHGVVELAVEELRQSLSTLDPADQAARQTILSQWLADGLNQRVLAWMKAAADRDHLQVFFDRGIQASIGRRVRRQAKASLEAILRQYQKDTFQPAFLEWTFGPKASDHLTLTLADGTLLAFRGKVDRVDLRSGPEGQVFRIIDYKSGDKQADFEDLYHGLALQLPAYLEAFAQNHPDCQAEDAAYFRFNRPMFKLAAGARPDPAQIQAKIEKDFVLRGLKLPPKDLTLLRRHTLRKAGELAGCLLGGDFAVQPRKLPQKRPACDYCVMMAVCGFDGKASGYHWLEPLCGQASKKREELLMRISPSEAEKEDTDDAAHT